MYRVSNYLPKVSEKKSIDSTRTEDSAWEGDTRDCSRMSLSTLINKWYYQSCIDVIWCSISTPMEAWPSAASFSMPGTCRRRMVLLYWGRYEVIHFQMGEYPPLAEP